MELLIHFLKHFSVECRATISSHDRKMQDWKRFKTGVVDLVVYLGDGNIRAMFDGANENEAIYYCLQLSIDSMVDW